MSTFQDNLQQGRIGRMPVWAFGVVLAGGIIVFMLVRNRIRSRAAVSPAGDPAATDSVEGIPAQSFASQLSGGFPQNVSVAPLPDRPQTNAQWLIAAFDYLVGTGKDPGLVQRSLQHYLNGNALPDQEQLIVNAALSNSNISLPPEGVTLGSATPTTPTTPGGATGIPSSVPAEVGVNLYTWVDKLNRDYPGLNATFEKLFGTFKGDPSALNPTARNYMNWAAGPGYKIPSLNRAMTIRIK